MAQKVGKPQIVQIREKYCKELFLYAYSVLTFLCTSVTAYCHTQDAGLGGLGMVFLHPQRKSSFVCYISGFCFFQISASRRDSNHKP